MGRLVAGTTALAIVAAIGFSLAALDPASYRHTAHGALGVESACRSVITRTLVPSEIRSCERSAVSLQLRPYCPGEPLNVVLVLSYMAQPTFAKECRAWTSAAIDALGMSTHPNVKVGIVYFRGNGTILLDLTNDEKEVRRKSRVEYVDDYAAPGLCIECVFSKAAQVLRAAGRRERKVIVFIGAMPWGPDPRYPRYGELYNDWFKGARIAKSAANPFVVGCPWFLGCKVSDWWTEASPGYYFEGQAPQQFADAIEALVKKTMRTDLAAVAVEDEWPTGVELVPGGAAPVPARVDPTTRRIRWDFTAPITQALTLTYQVQPLAIGTQRFAAGQAIITDTAQQARLLPLPTGALTVTGPCAPPTATPTATFLPTPTPTTAPTATATPPATPTSAPRPVFLPLALYEECLIGQRRVDVALVIDASTSMQEPTRDGGTKLAAAIGAVSTFLDELQLGAGDQAAIISFNADAQVLQRLTSDRQLLDHALGRIEVAPTTRLDRAVEVGHEVLASPERHSGNAAAMVLLTDGQANPVGPEVAVARAAAAKSDGITIFTIGLGGDLDLDALSAMASKPAYFYRAPGGEDLRAIYKAIAVAIPCPAEEFWGRRQ